MLYPAIFNWRGSPTPKSFSWANRMMWGLLLAVPVRPLLFHQVMDIIPYRFRCSFQNSNYALAWKLSHGLPPIKCVKPYNYTY